MNAHTKTSNGSQGQVAVVTGAGRGIGRALVETLRAKGYVVFAVVRSEESAREYNTLGDTNISAIQCDVTDPGCEATLREFLSNRTATIDLLINNAGFGASGYGIENLKFDELDKVLAVHCYGPIRCVRACLPFLRRSKGATIINVSSRFGSVEWVATGTVPHDQATYAYRIAKAAMNMLTSCLSVELQCENIRALSVDPGKVKTRFGPQDADTEPEEAARSIVGLVENGSETGLFLHASGEIVPW